MYNRQIDTFMKVAELGSFTKAAEALYISPSAIQQQINSLEANLGTRLFQRTSRGTSLTSAGSILYTEGKKLIDVSRDIRSQIESLEDDRPFDICVGMSPIEQNQLFCTWWNRFTMGEKRYRVRFKSISNLSDHRETEDVDILEGVYVGEVQAREYAFLQLSKVPIMYAVGKEQPLAEKKILRYEDLKGQQMVTLGGDNLLEPILRLRAQAEACGIRVITTDCYDIATFVMCAVNGYVLQVPQNGAYVHPGMVIIPSDLDCFLPCGLYYRKNASPLVREFVAYVCANLPDERRTVCVP